MEIPGVNDYPSCDQITWDQILIPNLSRTLILLLLQENIHLHFDHFDF